jgi:predicted glycoside hydrolase/deacetylase ChbG (UPF0249 family)
MSRCLIVNADDFGLSEGVNQGVIRAVEHGLVTSASLMVRGVAAVGAARYACGHPGVSLGLHVDLAEWVWQAGEWQLRYEVAPLLDLRAVRAEVRRQVACFVDLTGSPPTHLDSHQHLHRREPVKSVLLELAREMGVPLRGFSAIRNEARFYGQNAEGDLYPECISPRWFMRLVGEMPEGWTEIACHPGLDSKLDSVYAVERGVEVETLCDPGLRDWLLQQSVHLTTFREFRG